MEGDDEGSVHERWARLRFAIVGPLLASPPGRGGLRARLAALSQQKWRHPSSGEWVSFGVSTIERWYYVARNEPRDPVGALRRRVRRDAGTHPSMPAALVPTLRQQYVDHPTWSYQLHSDNLSVIAEEQEVPIQAPSYPSVRRYMQDAGLVRQRERGRSRHRGPGSTGPERRHAQQEVRSYEVEYVHGLSHFDFHECRRKLVTPRGELERPQLFALHDDRSRLCSHAQWYWAESAETLSHGLHQGFLKRGLPRRTMSDNGGAMLSEEVRRGLGALGIIHELTLANSPHQNAKAEKFFDTVEARLMKMLEGVDELTLELLNEATQAWVECEYNRRIHAELGVTPLHRYLAGPSVGRPSPDGEALRRAFRVQRARMQRMSDGTITIDGKRFEIPSRYRTLQRVHVRYARWDLRRVDLVDPKSGGVLCPLFPLDRQRNADGHRRKHARIEPGESLPEPTKSGMAPLLKKLMAEYSATGLPPAYAPLIGDSDDEVSPDERPHQHPSEDHSDEDEPA